MKKCLSLFLALVICLTGGLFVTASAATNTSTKSVSSGSSSNSFTYPTTDLSPNRKCPVQPTIYSKPRYRDTATDKVNNMSKGLSAKQINNPPDYRQYGLYFKFTPSRASNGYQIDRFDVVISDKNGTILYTEGFNANMTCQAGYYWYWDFFSLEGFYDNLRAIYGEVISGRFVMDIYFNSLWAGKTSITINK